ncbi:MAG: adenine phosphoribosyltransferase [Phycisphaerales bacterium]|nr:adenine phosphoribosyltransferase [Phycisphaerales bacterium]
MLDQLRALVRDIADFPSEGILFRDITPLLGDAAGLAMAVELMANPWRNDPPDIIVGAESRGFIFGTAIARALNRGFVPIRKPGKLPGVVHRATYELEYGTDELQLHADSIKPGQRVLIVDDLIATGGTLEASRDLVTATGAQIAGFSVLIELVDLDGRARLDPLHVHSVLTY